MAQLRTKHNFLNDTKGRIYGYVNVDETTEHYLFDCSRFYSQRNKLMQQLLTHDIAFG